MPLQGMLIEAIAKLDNADKIPLTLEQASYTITQALGIKATAAEAQAKLMESKLLTAATLNLIADKQKLTNGDTYMMIRRC